MKKILLMHFQKYPQMQIQDAVKLIFQSEFGPGHLIENKEYARNYLIQEMNEIQNGCFEMIEISNDLVRFHLGKMDASQVDVIVDAMILTTKEYTGSMDSFYKKLNVLKEMNMFPLEEIDDYLNQYLNGKSLVVSHTELYRDLYHPHYRVLKRELAEKVLNELHQ